jgi:hypothetical protein
LISGADLVQDVDLSKLEMPQIQRLTLVSEQQVPGEDCVGRNSGCLKDCIGRALVWYASNGHKVNLSGPEFLCGLEIRNLGYDEQVVAYRALRRGGSSRRPTVHNIIIATEELAPGAVSLLPGVTQTGIDNYADRVISRLVVDFDGRPAALPSQNES